MRLRLALCGLLLAMPAWAASPQAMAGIWFGVGQPQDSHAMYNDRFEADGNFRSQHRWCEGPRVRSGSETGNWSVSGDTLTIRIATVDGASEPRTDVYRILSVDAVSQHYVYEPLKFAFRSRRVDANFAMPPATCQAAS
jgi:hypothetical protein